METDEQLRVRLRYIGAWPEEAVATYTGIALDDLSWRFQLRRRAL